MKKQDVDRVVEVHLASFQGFFLNFLGSRFLSLYYSGICSSPEGIALIHANEDGIPVGFVVGASDPRGFYSKLLKRDWMRFSFASLGPIFKKPTAIVRIARSFFHPSKNPVGDDTAGLFSIAVMPYLQQSGIGEKLVQGFFDEADRRGCTRVYLTTDRDNNDAVNAFYLKLGFKIERQYVTPEGRKMNEYWKIILSHYSE
jgi:ribosomal protein S18 acetylase RimI-like enzyme